MVRPRDLTRGPGLGVDRCRNFLVAGRCRRRDRQHARLPRGSLGRWRGVRRRWLDRLPFRREERLGRLASARDPLTVITVRGLLLLPVIEQRSSRLFGCSRYRSGIRQLWQVVTADAGCHVNIKINKSPKGIFWKLHAFGLNTAAHACAGVARTVSSPREIFEQQYQAAAAEGALYELYMRLLADKMPELQQSAYGERLEDVEGLIIVHLSSALTEDEKNHLKLCRQLRNKILHCDFHAARKKLKELGADPQPGNVRRTDISGLSGRQMAEKISSALANASGSSEYVADLASRAGTVFGWLLEAGGAGDFAKAADSFKRGAAIVDRLARNS
jgi:hypothetical protein